MNKIIEEISDNKATLTLVEDGSILIEGNYFVINDKNLSEGNKDVRISADDILDVGITSFSDTSDLIKSCILFILAGGTTTLKGTIGGYAGDVKGVFDQTKDTLDFVDKATNANGVSELASTAGEAAGFMSDIANTADTILLVTAIVLLVLSIITLIKYALSYKKLFEVNTPYGKFCIECKSIDKGRISRFIEKYNLLKRSRR